MALALGNPISKLVHVQLVVAILVNLRHKGSHFRMAEALARQPHNFNSHRADHGTVSGDLFSMSWLDMGTLRCYHCTLARVQVVATCHQNCRRGASTIGLEKVPHVSESTELLHACQFAATVLFCCPNKHCSLDIAKSLKIWLKHTV